MATESDLLGVVNTSIASLAAVNVARLIGRTPSPRRKKKRKKGVKR